MLHIQRSLSDYSHKSTQGGGAEPATLISALRSISTSTPLDTARGAGQHATAAIAHAHNQSLLAHWVSTVQSQYPNNPRGFLQSVQVELPKQLQGLVKQGKLLLQHYAGKGPEVGAYGKHLLYSHPDPQHPWCLQLFVFEPGQRTPLHNHPCECLSVVVQGQLVEELVNQPGSTGQQMQRPSGSAGFFDAQHLDIAHRLNNHHHVNFTLQAGANHLRATLRAAAPAISVHLYSGMDGLGHETAKVSAQRPVDQSSIMVGVSAVKEIFAA